MSFDGKTGDRLSTTPTAAARDAVFPAGRSAVRLVIGLLLFFALLLAGVRSSLSQDLIEEPGFFRVRIGGHHVKLDGLIVKKADAVGRLPIVLITHGKPLGLEKTRALRASDMIGPARDLARRGWLAAVVVRRGYGRSDGALPLITCRSPSFDPWFSSEADDLLAALDFVARRPDADPARAIAIGESAGGAAVSALSARNPKNLLAVVNVSGGLRINDCPKDDTLVAAFKHLGEKSHVPNLWIYARNDSYFNRPLVERMHAAFREGGASAELALQLSTDVDGHALFASPSGRLRWLAALDTFLRSRGLPTWDESEVDALMRRTKADESNRAFLAQYVGAPSEKALAQSENGNFWHNSFGQKTIGDARKKAVELCERFGPGGRCVVVMENDRWIGPSEGAAQ